jgi:hypothetical protein
MASNDSQKEMSRKCTLPFSLRRRTITPGCREWLSIREALFHGCSFDTRRPKLPVPCHATFWQSSINLHKCRLVNPLLNRHNGRHFNRRRVEQCAQQSKIRRTTKTSSNKSLDQAVGCMCGLDGISPTIYLSVPNLPTPIPK